MVYKSYSMGAVVYALYATSWNVKTLKSHLPGIGVN